MNSNIYTLYRRWYSSNSHRMEAKRKSMRIKMLRLFGRLSLKLWRFSLFFLSLILIRLFRLFFFLLKDKKALKTIEIKYTCLFLLDDFVYVFLLLTLLPFHCIVFIHHQTSTFFCNIVIVKQKFHQSLTRLDCAKIS